MSVAQAADIVPLALAMMLSAPAAWGGSLRAIAVLALLGLWLRVDKLFEGPLIVEFSERHGVVVADLWGLLALLFSAACGMRKVKSGSPGRWSRPPSS